MLIRIKTIREHIRMRTFLEEKGCFEAFERNVRELNEPNENRSPKTEINAGFVWHQSPEGEEFWKKLHEEFEILKENDGVPE